MMFRIQKTADWEPFEDEIRRCYFEDGWTRKAVQQHMLNKYGLKATERQYKRLLAKNGDKKNITARQWKAIGVLHRRRLLENKETRVIFRNEPLKDERVTRALFRYKDQIAEASVKDMAVLTSDFEMRTPSPVPYTPSAMSICASCSKEGSPHRPPATQSPAYYDYDNSALDIPYVEVEDHWETISLYVPSEAMSDVDLGNAANIARKLWLHGLPSSQFLLNFSRDDYQEYQTLEDQASQFMFWDAFEANSLSPARRIDHCWSWDALRTILANACSGVARYRLSLPHSMDAKWDLALCTNTELLNIFVSINLIPPLIARQHRWLSDLLRWSISKQHHKLLSAIVLSQEGKLSKAFSRCFLDNIQDVCLDSYYIDEDSPDATRVKLEAVEVHRTILAALGKKQLKLSIKTATEILRNTLPLTSSALTRDMIEHGAKVNSEQCLLERGSILFEAIRSGDVGVAKAVLEHGARPQHVTCFTNLGDEIVQEEVHVQGREPRHSPRGPVHDMNFPEFPAVVKNLHNEKSSIFTCLEYCAFRAPSFCQVLQEHLPEFGRSQITKLLIAAAEGETPPSGISMCAKEIALLGAAEFSNFHLAQWLLDSGVDPDCYLARKFITSNAEWAKDDADIPLLPLEHAFRRKRGDIARLLLDAGACLNERMFRNFLPQQQEMPSIVRFLKYLTPQLQQSSLVAARRSLLWPAIYDQDTRLIDYLVSWNVCKDYYMSQTMSNISKYGMSWVHTPLTFALECSNQAMIHFVWQKGAAFMDSDSFPGTTEIGIVCENFLQGTDMLAKLSFLIEKGACLDGPCGLASPRGTGAPLQCLLNYAPRSNIGKEGEEKVRQALELLLDHGADINCTLSEESTPLQIASLHGYQNIVKVLVGRGADVNLSRGLHESPLASIARSGDIAIARYLIRHSAYVSGEELIGASRWNDLAMVQFLIESGADIDFVDKLGNTPLISACRYGSLNVAKLLLELGADVYRPCLKWETPLTAACIGGHTSIVKHLIAHGVDVNAVHAEGEYRTALDAAVHQGNFEITLMLLEAGANADTSDPEEIFGLTRQEFTAIELAAGFGMLDMVKLLINAGAEKNVQKNRFAFAIKIAESYGFYEITELLREHASPE